jgi:Tol biopolymer transport system component
VPGVDELLRRSVDELTEEVPPGDFAQVARRRRRLRHLRRVRSAALALVVVAASAGGLLALARVFGVGETAPRPAAILGDGAVAFVSDADGDAEIYLLHGDGTSIQLTDNDVDDLAPAWSPDGTRIAFLRREEREFHIFVMNADGSEEREVIPAGSGVVAGELTGDAWFSRLSWSPDGGRIVFAGRRSTADPSCPLDPCSSELYSVSVEGSELEQLTDTPMLDEWDPAWAPKGGLIAFVRTGRRTEGDSVPPRIPQLHVMAPDGSKVRSLTSVGAGATKPSWSPAGTMIAFESDGDIAVVNADGTGLRRLVNLPPPGDVANRAPHPSYGNYEPSWSPDGSWIVFSSDRNGSRKLYAMSPDGTEDQALALIDLQGEQWAPAWQPTPSKDRRQPGPPPDATSSGDDVLISSGDRLLRGSVELRAESAQLALVVDDLRGGLVFQYFDPPPGVPGTVMWLASGASEPRPIVTPIGEAVIELHEVAEIEGSPTLLATRWGHSGSSGGLVQELLLHDLSSGRTRIPLEIEGEGRWATRVSHADGRLLLSTGAGFELRSLEGLSAAGASLPEATGLVAHGVLSADGTLMSYVEHSRRRFDSPADLVLFDLVQGRERARTRVTEDGFRVRRVELEGGRVLVSREDMRDLGGFGHEFLPLLGKVGPSSDLRLRELELPARTEDLAQPLVASFVRSALRIPEGGRLSP